MHSTYTYPKFEVVKAPEIGADGRRRHPVIVVGAGPVGLAAAIDLAQSGTPVLLLDDDDTVSIGSRGVCYAKRTLEIMDRLGLGDAICDKGVSWNVGRTFFREEEVYNFNLLAQPDHKRPGMINLQQYYLEEFLVRRAEALPVLDLRWKNKVAAVEPKADGATLTIETPDGAYQVDCDWLIVADGARSNIRRTLGLEIDGKTFQDRFLIADVVMKADFPAERWFWFDPPFHPGQSVLLHRQADNVYRIDFQLGWQADPEEEKKPEKVIPRIEAMLADRKTGKVPEFELEWVSVYTFRCRRMSEFRHGRLLFVGDAAHQVSPFGARGGNSGIQDVDNLGWKLRLVMAGKAPASLLDSWAAERIFAADENMRVTTSSTDFITPKSPVSLGFRNAVLSLARHHPFARALVNSGRLSVPAILAESPLNTPDADVFAGNMLPGASMEDAPVRDGDRPRWLLDLTGERFVALIVVDDVASVTPAMIAALGEFSHAPIPLEALIVSAAGGTVAGLRVVADIAGRVAERYDAKDGSTYLIRPDQHVCARWRRFDASAIGAALARATGNAEPSGAKPPTAGTNDNDRPQETPHA